MMIPLFTPAEHATLQQALEALNDPFVQAHRAAQLGGLAVDKDALDNLRSRVLAGPLEPPGRADEQIVEQTNQLALELYRLGGHALADTSSPGTFKFYQARRGRELLAWEQARAAQQALTNTDPNDALDNLGLEHA